VQKNTDLCVHQTGGTDAARRVAEDMGGAWAEFARSGDPGRRWREWGEARPTYLFDDPGRCVDRFDDAALEQARAHPVA
jgi:carboxylesterase type B